MPKPDAATLIELQKMPRRKRRMLAYLVRQDDDERLTRNDLARVLRVRQLNRHAIRELEELVASYWVYRNKKWIVERQETFQITTDGEKRIRRRLRRWYYTYHVSPNVKPLLKAALKPKRKPTRPVQQPMSVSYGSRWSWLKHKLGFWR